MMDELTRLRRLHEIATQRTVDLAAVIEQAKAGLLRVWNVIVLDDQLPEPPGLREVAALLEAADTDDALRDVRAKAWWEGVEWQWKHRPVGNRAPETENPYRKEVD